MNTLRLPFFEQLKRAETVLIAGAGGGFDVFSGLPLYFNLRAAGKTVHLANPSFSNLSLATAGRRITPELVEVTADSDGSALYFPEKHLSQWFRDHGKEVPIYSFHRTGSRPIIEGYRVLCAELKPDTILLVDGGTDSLLCGDEDGLGTPEEDMSSIAAVNLLEGVQRKILVCLGFGIDAFHGVCHSHVLESIAELIRTGGYLGAFSLTEDMPEVQRFREATQYVLQQMPHNVSIVCTSILAALEGRFGDYHSTERTFGSELFINPLMSLYRSFWLERVARRVSYLPGLASIDGYAALSAYIRSHHAGQSVIRPSRPLPM